MIIIEKTEVRCDRLVSAFVTGLPKCMTFLVLRDDSATGSLDVSDLFEARWLLKYGGGGPPRNQVRYD